MRKNPRKRWVCRSALGLYRKGRFGDLVTPHLDEARIYFTPQRKRYLGSDWLEVQIVLKESPAND